MPCGVPLGEIGGKHMRRSLAFAPLLLAGCAVPTTVQRIGVGYNTAVANLTDQLTLLNVVRAHHGYPLHYTSLTRLSGSLTFKGTAGIGSQFNLKGHDNTTTTSTGDSNAVEIAKEVNSAAHQLTPSIGAEVDSNPSFDVDVDDTKEFYQGIMTSVEPVIIADLIAQGYDPQDLFALALIKVDFKLKKAPTGYDVPVGTRLLSLPTDYRSQKPNDKLWAYDQQQLALLFACYDFSIDDDKPTDLAPVSRLVAAPDKDGLSIKDLALLDGEKLDLSAPIGSTADSKVMIQRPGKDVGRFTWSGKDPRCTALVAQARRAGGADPTHQPSEPPPDITFVGSDKVLVPASMPGRRGDTIAAEAEVDISATFRSPEAIIQFIGDCLAKIPNTDTLRCVVNGRALFEVQEGKGGDGTIPAELGEHRYFIDPESRNGPTTLRTLGVIEKLLDLHRSSTDKPSTVPVHVVS